MDDDYEVIENIEDNQNYDFAKPKEKVQLDKDGEVAKKAAVTAATVYGGKLGGNLVKAASHTKLGKNVLNTGGKMLNGGNSIVSNINRNPLGTMMQNRVNNQNSEIQNNYSSLDKSSDLNNSNEIDDIKNKKTSSNNLFNSNDNNRFNFSFFGKNKKMSFMLKLKLYFAIGVASLIMFIILFIILFLDVGMDKMLGTLNWNNDVVDTDSGVSSETGFSSDNSSTINSNNLSIIIGDDAIKELESNITSKVGVNICTRKGVANALIALIDGLNKHNLKIPYKEGGRASRGFIVDTSWGVSTDAEGNEVRNGLDDKGLLMWAMDVTSVSITNDFDFNIIEDFSSLDEIYPGDIIRGEDIKIVLQNTGSSLIVADAIKGDGITYKEYKYEELTSYSYVNMANFYSVNCTN